ncbi:hemerythrin HHE cation binding domain-containing protein [Microdochium trichocladiopsis]|uniref:Hemerythrin HHE cation binding domain-containing protein n=1 Tax=Microdochium trichocladiopsis TaxID=1682393 RepID=A0A9P9C0A2_9PEZI|nr:hemerythrin HHE cation binding domain-containing protein [Microdochium trichocladiopsis]KAH7040919.1 hemerythrin HHE cation binding domain-containing protein [Microdochium trichocladiopsis]
MAPVFADRPFAPIPTPMVILAKGEKPDEFTVLATEMACVHNFLIRGLNAIYLQAPHIRTPADQHAFLNFAHQWYRGLHVHHTGEEELFFPMLEARTGIKGIMDGNVAQHAQFERGVDELDAYVQRCLQNPSAYDGDKIVGMIDSFGAVLRQHLADEIPTLLALREHADKLAGMYKEFSDEGAKHMQTLGLFKGAACVIATHDVDYEGGLHRGFPPAPAVLVWLLRNVAWWVHRDWWRFAPCDRHGRMKDLSCNITKGSSAAAAAAAEVRQETVSVVRKGDL